nr:putative methylcytosine dioxygenase isoform 1 [Xenopus laevis]
METQPTSLPHVLPQDVYEFCDDRKSLGRLRVSEMPAESNGDGGGSKGDGAAVVAKEVPEQSNKKRKRCGVCVPCLRKEPCGACYNCVNRSTSHQICKMRKCEQLKKKRVVPLKGVEAVNKDDSKNQAKEQVPNVKNCSESILVDGPKTDQMEAGPVNHVQEGRLKKECDSTLPSKACEDLANQLLMEANSWLSNTAAPQDPCNKLNWDKPTIPNHTAATNNSNLEDAKNLVAFSAVAEAMSNYGMPASGTPSSVSMQLYEKFNYETNRDSSGHPEGNAPSCPEDLNTLKTALALAKHGVKPPNCNCDGPECPDYLEWLENKIKSSQKDSQESSFPGLGQVSKELVQKSYPKEEVLNLENKNLCPSGNLPFSQNALSLAKEKNISLQTAIAIEALTQLSSALPQTNNECPNSSSQPLINTCDQLTHFPTAKGNQLPIFPMACNELFQNQQSQLYTGKNALPVPQSPRQTSWEQNKKPSYQEGQYIPENLSQSSSVLPSDASTPQKTEFLQQWIQNADLLKSPSDPMTGLKQLLGNTDEYIKSVFKGPEALPNKIKHVKTKRTIKSIKKKSSDFLKMSPDQQLSQLLQENDFHHNAQAVLQQHLHHKRNLFVDPNTMEACAQEQQNWWVPKSQKLPVSKTTENPVKERKKRRQRSPSQKQVEPKPKPPRKQVQIKKPRMKEGNAVFMPVSQISLDAFRGAEKEENQLKEMNLEKSLSNNIQPDLLESQSILVTGSQANIENRKTVNTQETCNENQASNGKASNFALCVNQANSLGAKDSCPTPSTDDASSSSGQGDSANQHTNVGDVPGQNDLSCLDDKFEDLLRQFEAEFGEDFSLPGSEAPSQNGVGPPKQQISGDPQFKMPFPSQLLPSENSTRPDAHSNPALSNNPISHNVSHNLDSLFSSKSPKKIKIESSGAITVVSTTCFYSEENQHLDGTPTKSDLPFNPTLSGFLESPLKYLTSPTKSLIDTPAKMAQAEFPTCDCVEQINEKDEGPYYTHLGSGPTVASIRELMEDRFGEKGEAIRIEKVIYTGKEGKSSRGCPIAKWVIRRQSEDEKLMCLVRQRAGHHCENAVIIILIMAWEGIPRALGDSLYSDITETITKYGNPTSRRCGLNDDRTCACQGKDPNTCGASFSFGCSWSMYFNGCKYARSKTPRKFRLIGDNPKEEEFLNDNFQDLATKVAPVYQMLAPQSYENQVNNEEVAIDCRLGLKEGRPFSGVTACMDFCAHAHKDQHNLYNGCTVVCTLTKEDNRTIGRIPEDEQLHVLPLYKVSSTDEFGSEDGQAEKIRKGGIQVLASFPREVRKLSEPAKSCRQRQLDAKKAAAEKKKLQKEKLVSPDKTKQEPADTKMCQQNPGVPQQQTKPCVKVEPSNHYNTYKYNGNGVVESYSVLGSCRPSDPYSMNSVYSYHSFYAQPNLPSVNGFHSKFALPPFGFYGFPNNPVVPNQFMNYGTSDARNSGWMNNSFEKKPDVQSLADGMNQSYGSELPEQSYRRSSEVPHHYSLQNPNSQKSFNISHRTTPSPMETTPYSNLPCYNKVIKKEPVCDPLVDPFQRANSVHSQSPGVNHSLQTSDLPFKANGALPSSGRSNAEGPCSMSLPNDKSGLEKRDYFGVHSNVPALKDKQWTPYGTDVPVGQRDSLDAQSPGKVWSSCKLSDSPAVLPSFASTQTKNWNGRQASLNQGLKEPMPFQEKLWNSVAASDRCSVTPSDRSSVTPCAELQDKNWASFPNPVGNSLKTESSQNHWDPYSLDDNMDDGQSKSVKEEEDEEEIWSDSEHNFLDKNIGGVAVAPGHGSILIECARRELHATTPLKKPNRCHPARISLVFYQHKNLNQPNHGLALWEAKMKLLAERARVKEEEAARLGIKQEVKSLGKKRKWGGAATTETPPVEKKDFIPTRQATTILTDSATTAFSYAYTKVTGPYSRFI